MSIEEVSKTELYIQQKQWNHRATEDHVLLEICPINQCDNWHFYIRKGGEKDGLWDCKKCGESGTLYTLREKLGDLVSTTDMTGKKPDPLPDVLRCQATLEADEDAMNYLLDKRGFSPALIKQMFLGLMNQNGKKYLVIPYIEQSRIVYAKYRSLPPAEKGFFCPKGREAILYNADVITQGMEELVLVEGELNVVACIGQNMKNVVGVPGANNKNMTWISRIDAAAPKKIYILFDNDINNKHNTGQEAAEELAKRIALNTALPTPMNIVLPEFEKLDGTRGKDLNDWFQSGHTVAEFDAVKAQAVVFEVRGVVNANDALTLLEESLEGREILQPTYVTQYPSFNKRIGGFEPGDVTDIIAKAKIGKTTLAINLLDHLVSTYNEPGFIHCLEMPTARMVRKWVSMVTNTDDSPPTSEEDGRARMLAMRRAIPIARDLITTRTGELLFCDRVVKHPDEVYEIWYQAVRRFGIKFGVFDNLQLLSDLTLRRSAERTIHMSQISKHLKGMATELRLVLFRIVQPKKTFKDAMVTHEDADGSSQIEKDCDASISLSRQPSGVVTQEQLEAMGGFMDVEMAFDPKLFTNVTITRYAAGGACTLWMDGARSKVRELTPLEFSNIKAVPMGSKMHTLRQDTGISVDA